MTDWQELLKKYIEHVIRCEGVSFIGPNDNWPEILTDEEMKTLEKLQEEMGFVNIVGFMK